LFLHPFANLFLLLGTMVKATTPIPSEEELMKIISVDEAKRKAIEEANRRAAEQTSEDSKLKDAEEAERNAELEEAKEAKRKAIEKAKRARKAVNRAARKANNEDAAAAESKDRLSVLIEDWLRAEEKEAQRRAKKAAAKKRLAEKAAAEEAEQKAAAEEAEQKAAAAEAEQKAAAAEAERKRLAAEEAERQRLAEEAERQRLAEEAAEAERKRVAAKVERFERQKTAFLRSASRSAKTEAEKAINRRLRHHRRPLVSMYRHVVHDIYKDAEKRAGECLDARKNRDALSHVLIAQRLRVVATESYGSRSDANHKYPILILGQFASELVSHILRNETAAFAGFIEPLLFRMLYKRQ